MRSKIKIKYKKRQAETRTRVVSGLGFKTENSSKKAADYPDENAAH
jgi:hypothetical protein